MSHARIYFVKLNLDDFAATVAGLDSDLEYRQFIDGFLVGARGFEARDTWSEAKINGHTIGDGCFKDAQRFSAAQREKVMHRYHNESTELPRNYHGSTDELPENYLTNNQQPTASNHHKDAASPSAPLLPEVVNGHKVPRGKKAKKFGIAALGANPQQEAAFDRVWFGWPREGWNYQTKTSSPRRTKRALAIERFLEILTYFPHKVDGQPLNADQLADAALSFVAQRISEANGGIPNVPCIQNFFSTEDASIKHWKDALLAHFGEPA